MYSGSTHNIEVLMMNDHDDDDNDDDILSLSQNYYIILNVRFIVLQN